MLRTILLFLFFTAMVTYAQNDTVVAEKDAAAAGQQEPSGDPSQEETKTPEELTPDTFDPTEELSRDNSVPFPVDI